MVILGIETSCDETSAAIMADGVLKSNIISSQLIHSQYGGVVPELASRAHLQLIVPIVDEALKSANISKENLNGVAVTYGPGLIGALLVGLSFAKSFAYQLNIPFVGVNHMEAHLYTNFINPPTPEYPFVCLIVSGGHTQLVYVKEPFNHELIGETLDDAGGEAYDKVAKMLGLGFPGGPSLDKLARDGNPEFVKFPRSYLESNSFEFSFSGIKTAVLYWLKNNGYYPFAQNSKKISEQTLKDLSASFQAAMMDVLVEKTMRAVKKYSVKDLSISGGVSANSELRKRLLQYGKESSIRVFIPPLEICTDNGAMVALVGSMLLNRGIKSSFELTAAANLSIGNQ
jgi:N6-L-threonylcarbamoyladenine synthase